MHYYIALLNLKYIIKILNKLIIIYNKTNVLIIRIDFSNNIFEELYYILELLILYIFLNKIYLNIKILIAQ